MERKAPHVMQLHSLDGSSPSGDGHGELVPQPETPPATSQPATSGRRPMAASFQLNVDNAAQVICPHCSKPSESIGLALNLKIGPVPEGVQVLMVRPGATMREVVDDVRRALINDALGRVNNNQARAAKLLGMKYTTFHTLARRLGIVRGGPKNDSPDGSD